MTGGHGDLNRYAPQVRVQMFPEDRDFKIADGVDQVRQVVRAQLKYGVDVIKVHATGGVLSRGDQPGNMRSSRPTHAGKGTMLYFPFTPFSALHSANLRTKLSGISAGHSRQLRW